MTAQPWPRRKKFFAIVAALAVLAVALGLVAQYNKESRAAVRKPPPAVPVTVARSLPRPCRSVFTRSATSSRLPPWRSRRGSTGRSTACISTKATKSGRGSCCSRSIRGRSPQRSSRCRPTCCVTGRCSTAPTDQEKRYKDLLAQELHLARRLRPGEDQHGERRGNGTRRRGGGRQRQACSSTIARSARRSPATPGKIAIQRGNLVKANDTNPLVTINQVVPIYVSFSVPEQKPERRAPAPGQGRSRRAGQRRRTPPMRRSTAS